MNVIARLDIELVYFETAVQHFNQLLPYNVFNSQARSMYLSNISLSFT